ncbi:hypothetical protein FQN54_001930 [Arachnomyces sp. PD_36]|nr:hypothetical protein FQN54_001930 [Arachnomyces sp. PD_36]
MASLVVIAVGAGIYVAAEKIHDRKEKKRALKAQQALEQDSFEKDSVIADATEPGKMDELPAYHQENLPPYQRVDQHPASKAAKKRDDSPRRKFFHRS